MKIRTDPRFEFEYVGHPKTIEFNKVTNSVVITTDGKVTIAMTWTEWLAIKQKLADA